MIFKPVSTLSQWVIAATVQDIRPLCQRTPWLWIEEFWSVRLQDNIADAK